MSVSFPLQYMSKLVQSYVQVYIPVLFHEIGTFFLNIVQTFFFKFQVFKSSLTLWRSMKVRNFSKVNQSSLIKDRKLWKAVHTNKAETHQVIVFPQYSFSKK